MGERTIAELWEKTRQPYETKLEHAKTVIKEAIEADPDNIIIACSFGKASLVITHLALQIKPDIKVTFQNTLCEARGVYKTRNKLVKEWNLNFFETRPDPHVTFWSLKDKYGYPLFKSTREEQNKRSQYIQRSEPRCCYYLKKKPAKLLYKKLKITGIILGIQGIESYNRRFLIATRGCIQYVKHDGLWKYYPLAYWTNEDIWRYIKENSIPYPAEYDNGVERLGCVPCTAHIGWEQQLAAINPILYRKVKKDFNRIHKGLRDIMEFF